MSLRHLVPALAALCLPGLAAVESAPSFWEALTTGKASGSATLRLEFVDEDTFDDEAIALNARVSLAYETKSWKGVHGFIEFAHVAAVIDDFNSTRNGKTDYPIVADPELTELNQAFLRYDDEDQGLSLTLGRRRLSLDNTRHVGDVAWRLTQQTFDLLDATWKPMPGLTLYGAFVTVANTITGTNVHYDAAILLNAAYKIKDAGTLVGYLYHLDHDEEANLFSTRPDTTTFGGRFSGSRPVNEDFKLHYEAEFAFQRAETQAGDDFSTLYAHLVGGVSWEWLTGKIGYELLGSDDGEFGFATQLGTNHRFNGWADRFLTTPAVGLEEIYVQFIAEPPQLENTTLQLSYHRFSSDEDSISFGDEIDLQAIWKSPWKTTFGAKAALYSTDDEVGGPAARDATKFWLWATATF